MVSQVFSQIIFKADLRFFLSVDQKAVSIPDQLQIWFCADNRISSQIIDQGRIQEHTVFLTGEYMECLRRRYV